jgi:hypothetical protein
MTDVDDETINKMFPNLVPEAKFEFDDFMSEKKNTKFADSKCR